MTNMSAISPARSWRCFPMRDLAWLEAAQRPAWRARAVPFQQPLAWRLAARLRSSASCRRSKRSRAALSGLFRPDETLEFRLGRFLVCWRLGEGWVSIPRQSRTGRLESM